MNDFDLLFMILFRIYKIIFQLMKKIFSLKTLVLILEIINLLERVIFIINLFSLIIIPKLNYFQLLNPCYNTFNLKINKYTNFL